MGNSEFFAQDVEFEIKSTNFEDGIT